MVEFRSPAFAKLTRKLQRAQGEFDHLAAHVAAHEPAILLDEWAATTAAATGVHNVYNGIEDMLLDVARDVDGSVPGGPAARQSLLDQMAAPIRGVRAPLLTDALYGDLVELTGFRHLVRHRYGLELSGSKVIDNVDRMRRALPLFVAALLALDAALVAGTDGDPGAP